MSLCVKDLLKLPPMREARVIAGEKGLNHQINSVSVLEYSFSGITLESLYNSNEFNGGEIVLSALACIKDDVDAQCLNVRRMAEVGEVGLVLYYVGVVLKKVDKRIIDLCNELSFPLICMPENRLDLRYSEVICEVMQEVFAQRQGYSLLVTDILGAAARLPEHQRSVDTVLKLLSDRERVSVALTDREYNILNLAAWPRTESLRIEKTIKNCENLYDTTQEFVENDGLLVYRIRVENGLQVVVVKDGAPLPIDFIQQASEAVRLASNLWGKNYGVVVMAELVRAILMDEPIKMQRLGEIFNVDVKVIDTMWVLKPDEQDYKSEFARIAPKLARELILHYSKTIVVDMYEDDLIVFMDNNTCTADVNSVVEELLNALELAGFKVSATLCIGLANTNDVRRAFLTTKSSLATAKRIWAKRRIYTIQELRFAKDCKEAIELGESAVKKRLKPLERIASDTELCETLDIYLLDAQNNIADCAQKMFLHKNTIKYRVSRIKEKLGYDIDKMPESFALYNACALKRILY